LDLDMEMRANRHSLSPYHLLLQFLQHNRCTYSRYCAAIQEYPEPLPENTKASRQMQLVLNL